MATTTTVYQSDGYQVVLLPPGFQVSTEQVAIRRQGDAVILEPIKMTGWTEGFLERIRIDDPAFERPSQGPMPPAPSL